jgi:hypothetical protein
MFKNNYMRFKIYAKVVSDCGSETIVVKEPTKPAIIVNAIVNGSMFKYTVGKSALDAYFTVSGDSACTPITYTVTKPDGSPVPSSYGTEIITLENSMEIKRTAYVSNLVKLTA